MTAWLRRLLGTPHTRTTKPVFGHPLPNPARAKAR